MVAQDAQLTRERRVVGRYDATFARRNRLTRMKAEAAHHTPCARALVMELSTERAGCILDDRHAVRRRCFENARHVGHAAEGVDRQDGLNLRALEQSDQSGRVHVERAGLDLDENGIGATQSYHVCSRRPRIGRHRHTIARPNVKSH